MDRPNREAKEIAYAKGLRELATLFENGQLPLPYDIEINVYWNTMDDGTLGTHINADDARKAMDNAPGEWDKEFSGDYLTYTKTLSKGVTYSLEVKRDTVCKKIVTGQREIPARIIDIVEWECQ